MSETHEIEGVTVMGQIEGGGNPPDSGSVCILWITAAQESVASYRRMIDGILGQLSDEELFRRPIPEGNSVAVLLRHLGGNLKSRWTDFLTTDGEKPWRDRDSEFKDWEGDRSSLLEFFEDGWSTLAGALKGLDEGALSRTVTIRGEPHTIAQAVTRSLAHAAYHVGQIAFVARVVHSGEWKWLTIAPGKSAEHNAATWGSSASRSVFGVSHEK